MKDTDLVIDSFYRRKEIDSEIFKSPETIIDKCNIDINNDPLLIKMNDVLKKKTDQRIEIEIECILDRILYKTNCYFVFRSKK